MDNVIEFNAEMRLLVLYSENKMQDITMLLDSFCIKYTYSEESTFLKVRLEDAYTTLSVLEMAGFVFVTMGYEVIDNAKGECIILE